MGWGSKALADKEDVNNEGAELRGSFIGIKTKADKEDVDNEPFVANLPALTRCNRQCQYACYTQLDNCIMYGIPTSDCRDTYNTCKEGTNDADMMLANKEVVDNEGAELRGSILKSIVADV